MATTDITLRDGRTVRLRPAPGAGLGLIAIAVPQVAATLVVGQVTGRLADSRATCEFAITIDPAYAGTGLATTLMTALIEEARGCAVKEMRGSVPREDAAMLRVARRLGFSVEDDPADPALRTCRLQLGRDWQPIRRTDPAGSAR